MFENIFPHGLVTIGFINKQIQDISALNYYYAK